MGFFRILRVSLPCRRCGFVRPVDVQFKTDDDRVMSSYEPGDLADDVEPDTYGGLADAYCVRCDRRWVEDEKRIHFAVVAEDIAAGRVVARRASSIYGVREGHPEPGLVVTAEPGPAITPDEMCACADVPVSFTWSSFPARLWGIALWYGDLRVHPHDSEHDCGPWWRSHNAEVAARLRALGWPECDTQWIELDVVVDAEHRVALAAT